MPRAKIIVLTHEFSPFRGGAAIYAEELAEAMVRLGHEAEVWAPDYSGQSDVVGPSTSPTMEGRAPRARDDDAASQSSALYHSFRLVRLPAGGNLHPSHMIQYTRALRARASLMNEATIIPVSVGAHMALMILSSLTRVRFGEIISVLHGSEVLRFRSNPLCRLLARRFFQSRVHRVATVSEFSKSLIAKSQLLMKDQSILVAPGACSSAAKMETRARTLPSESLKILTLARIDPRKGQLDAARSLARLPAETRKMVLYQIAGRSNPSYLREIEQTCRDGNVPFVYLGEIAPSELAATYTQCDIYAMTSRLLPRSVEGFGLTYLEAGFHGRPVVAYRSGGASEAVIDNESGLLVAEGNVAALTEAFARLIASPELRQRLGEGGRRNCARYNWETTARILIDSKSS
jgi:phosphatidylinositol alpha-1,6-mannosyltransferase